MQTIKSIVTKTKNTTVTAGKAVKKLFSRTTVESLGPAIPMDGELRLPPLTSYQEVRETYFTDKKTIKQTINMVRIDLSDGGSLHIEANTLPPKLDLPEMRALEEYMGQEGFATIGDAAALTGTAKDNYNTVEVNKSSIKSKTVVK